MAKVKGQPGVQNRIIYSRASYLYQAATYLRKCVDNIEECSPLKNTTSKDEHSVNDQSNKKRKAINNISRMAISEMRAISLKAQIRQSPSLKQTICKFCDSLLVEGRSCSSTIENTSKGGRKSWADVLVIKCETCGNAKRFPVDAPRQKRRGLRSIEAKAQEMEAQESNDKAKDDT